MKERELLDLRYGAGLQEPRDWFKVVDHGEEFMHKTDSVVIQIH